jgi:hypothetical protein
MIEPEFIEPVIQMFEDLNRPPSILISMSCKPASTEIEPSQSEQSSLGDRHGEICSPSINARIEVRIMGADQLAPSSWNLRPLF